MFKRTLTSGLVAIFVATGALAGTVGTSSAHGMHGHHHNHHHKKHFKKFWWKHYNHHHNHHHRHGRVIIFL
ncbi:MULTISPECIES: hypothetical protein [unclassified Mesorhizobium]|jgi:hypothetical protein|uniref:hypothetical protein n=1 Tax=unclassified Mesorhizobium TaxID=325217 RepID=UPI000FCCA0E5|nr:MULTISPECIES: hypothetical protein [unclassified Mesorhizobium]AZV21791.1 hypothetical protein EJ079_23520 [Mesorhizobium sp. M7A.F.Ce.TU.012.03.2.1]RUU85786.1 hypothetical protein EOB59_31085 [Mesorhizobium sp. M7A.F.Ca.MR.176.00.0.0]RVD14567.1 hypothetical protein EN749_19190 [Mesorhizobium sp. M7A.F.Ca.ET.027.02.1.1]RVD63942.1 hypothetical protein EN750_14995 [Mesorhizobium sp. M7A.F.Ca.ET.027.03.2.1]RWD03921.1 MAG: hypothetical protein EOS73_21080 [Mesorhizobium sp.]